MYRASWLLFLCVGCVPAMPAGDLQTERRIPIMAGEGPGPEDTGVVGRGNSAQGQAEITTSNGVTKWVFPWVSDDGGVVIATQTTPLFGRIQYLATIPGTENIQPNNGYDVSILDENDYDVLHAAGENQTNSSTNETPITTEQSQYVAVTEPVFKIVQAGSRNQGTVIILVTE